MKFIKTLFFFLFLTTCFTSYANENKHVFVGKIGSGESEKVAFILNLVDENIEEFIQISAVTGEVFIKADKVVAIPKDSLSQVSFFSGEFASDFTTAFTNSRDDEPAVRCSNCRQYYEPQYYRGRRCPNCDTPN